MNSSILATLFLAIISVESGGNDAAYNARENAAGCAQIRLICLIDVNRLGYNYTPEDRFNRQKSYEIFCIYVTHYGARTPEQAARIWNGGPRGASKKATLSYWNKVKSAMAPCSSLKSVAPIAPPAPAGLLNSTAASRESRDNTVCLWHTVALKGGTTFPPGHKCEKCDGKNTACMDRILTTCE